MATEMWIDARRRSRQRGWEPRPLEAADGRAGIGAATKDVEVLEALLKCRWKTRRCVL
jgi:hypothetical protein